MASPIKSNKSKSVLHEIFEWSIERPAWQCDALRRIITKETFDDTDIADLEKLCRQVPGAVGADGQPLVAVPLTQEHLPAGPNAQTSVSIEYLNHLTGVNRLPADQKITFGQSPGLTIIYGDNGTGKSGYVRGIKKVCRTRGAPPVIRPDAFAPTPPKASCKIGITTSHGSSEVLWTDGTAADVKLGNVFVFDTAAASHYLMTDGPASFTPYGLDVLPKLTKVCDTIAGKIKGDIATLEREIAAGKLGLDKHLNTQVGNAVANISAKTVSANLMLLGGLTEMEANRLTELRALLGSDPKKKARETRAAKSRIETLKTHVEETAGMLSEIKIKELKESFENTAATEQAARISAETSFSDGVLVGTGSNLWRAMWEAAKTFSTTLAFPKDNFPNTENEARCVLCQRPFGNDTVAISLTKSFVKFCNDDVQTAAKTERSKLTERKNLFNGKKALKPEFENLTTDLCTLSAVELQLLTDFIESADDCLATINKSLKADKWTAPAGLATSPSAILKNLIDAVEKRAKTEESADDPTARQKFQSECNELIAKEWLKTVKTEVENQIGRYKQVDFLQERLVETKTNTITTKNSSLTKELITDAYCQKFADEINQLGVRMVNVKLEETGGTKGEKKFGIRLQGVVGPTNIFDIISEGEQRCVALAAFLAELSQSSHQSALVFDDPVSSLDHFYRGKIAARLTKEAKHRQVIVFTHDTVFLNDLSACADEEGIVCCSFYLRWDAKQPGWLEAGLPWECKTPQDRLEKIFQEQKALEKIWQPMPNEDLKKKMRDVYSDLRATIERIVEKVVFADVLFRFRSYVNLKGLSEVVGFPESENSEIQRLFKKCCDVTTAHDAPAGKQAPVPDPTELAQDIDATKKLLDSIRTRRKAAKGTA